MRLTHERFKKKTHIGINIKIHKEKDIQLWSNQVQLVHGLSLGFNKASYLVSDYIHKCILTRQLMRQTKEAISFVMAPKNRICINKISAYLAMDKNFVHLKLNTILKYISLV